MKATKRAPEQYRQENWRKHSGVSKTERESDIGSAQSVRARGMIHRAKRAGRGIPRELGKGSANRFQAFCGRELSQRDMSDLIQRSTASIRHADEPPKPKQREPEPKKGQDPSYYHVDDDAPIRVVANVRMPA